MDPEHCTDFKPDKAKTKEQENLLLVDLLNGAWSTKDIDRIERYDDVTLQDQSFNGWAYWKK